GPAVLVDDPAKRYRNPDQHADREKYLDVGVVADHPAESAVGQHAGDQVAEDLPAGAPPHCDSRLAVGTALATFKPARPRLVAPARDAAAAAWLAGLVRQDEVRLTGVVTGAVSALAGVRRVFLRLLPLRALRRAHGDHPLP